MSAQKLTDSERAELGDMIRELDLSALRADGISQTVETNRNRARILRRVLTLDALK